MKLSKAKKAIKNFDLFSKEVSLRYDGEPEYETLIGGFCSIILIVVFISVFASTLTNTLDRRYINSSVTQYNEP